MLAVDLGMGNELKSRDSDVDVTVSSAIKSTSRKILGAASETRDTKVSSSQKGRQIRCGHNQDHLQYYDKMVQCCIAPPRVTRNTKTFVQVLSIATRRCAPIPLEEASH
jgi:hypothetical protein